MRFETPKTGSPCSELRPKCVSNHLSSSTEKSRRIISENLRRDCHPNYHVYGNSYRSTPFRLSESLRFPTVRLRFNTRLQFDGHDAQHRPRGLAQSVFSSPPRLATSRPDLDMVRRVAEAKNALHYGVHTIMGHSWGVPKPCLLRSGNLGSRHCRNHPPMPS